MKTKNVIKINLIQLPISAALLSISVAIFTAFTGQVLALPAISGNLGVKNLISQNLISQNLDLQKPNALRLLNLSDAQKLQIRAILTKDKEARRQELQELRTQEEELRTIIDGNASRDVLLQKFNQVQNLRRQVAQKRFEQTLEIREILTPQQRSQLSQVARESRKNRKDQQKFRIKPDDQL